VTGHAFEEDGPVVRLRSLHPGRRPTVETSPEQGALKRWEDAEKAHTDAVRRFIADWWTASLDPDLLAPDRVTHDGLTELERLRAEADTARVALMKVHGS